MTGRHALAWAGPGAPSPVFTFALSLSPRACENLNFPPSAGPRRAEQKVEPLGKGCENNVVPSGEILR